MTKRAPTEDEGSAHRGSLVLFFGDSNTRGFGVGAEHRFAALLEAELASCRGNCWRFVVASAESDFRVIPPRLEAAVAEYEPTILVWQIPTGPATYFVAYPGWMQRLQAVNQAAHAWLHRRFVRAEVRAGTDRTERAVLYEGRYVDALHRWRVAAWPGMRRLKPMLAARYGSRPKATRERYLELVCRVRDQIRARTPAPILFLGFLPHDDNCYPGYLARVASWGPELARCLHDPENGFHYLELLNHLVQPPVRDVLIRDGTHLSREGHRLVADAVASPLLQLMRACTPVRQS